MIEYNKLVRDRIPDIIAANGGECECRYLEDTELSSALLAKLHEEVAEFAASGDISELADIQQVIWAIQKNLGVDSQDFMCICENKYRKCGGFEDGVFLIRASAP